MRYGLFHITTTTTTNPDSVCSTRAELFMTTLSSRELMCIHPPRLIITNSATDRESANVSIAIDSTKWWLHWAATTTSMDHSTKHEETTIVDMEESVKWGKKYDYLSLLVLAPSFGKGPN
jgi:hypothetical protein